TAGEILINDDAVVVGIAHTLDSEFRGLGRVKFEAEFPQGRFRDFRGIWICANERRLVAKFEEIHFLLRAHFFFPYSISSDRPVRPLVFSPLVFLTLSMPRVMTPLFVQYNSAVSSVIIVCSNSSRIAISNVFHPNEPAASMIS